MPTLGLAQLVASSAPFLAVIAARFVVMAARLVAGAAWSASLAACIAIFLARRCMSAGMAGCFLVVTDTDVLPRE